MKMCIQTCLPKVCCYYNGIHQQPQEGRVQSRHDCRTPKGVQTHRQQTRYLRPNPGPGPQDDALHCHGCYSQQQGT